MLDFLLTFLFQTLLSETTFHYSTVNFSFNNQSTETTHWKLFSHSVLVFSSNALVQVWMAYQYYDLLIATSYFIL